MKKTKVKKQIKRVKQKVNKKPEETPTQKQERFCQLYATDRNFFGNGVESYLEVYDIDRKKPNWYKTACSAASRLLSNVKVIQRINELLEAGGLNDQFVDKQLGFLITQHSDFSSKLGAIREYNKLKQRIIDNHKISGDKENPLFILKGIDDELINEIARRVKNKNTTRS